MWKTLGSIINPDKKQKQRQITKLIIDENIIENSQEISNEINRYFCTIGNKLATALPNGNSFKVYMKNKIPNTMFLSPIRESEVTTEIAKLNERKSSGPDNISPRILKFCEPELCTPLTNIFNCSIETATYPSKLKVAKVIALYKKNQHFYPKIIAL